MFFGTKSVAFNPVKDIPPLNGKIILVTGGNAGLGKQAVLDFARHNPDKIWLAARSLAKAEGAVKDIQDQLPQTQTQIKPLVLDLASFASIKAAAETILAGSSRLDILMLNGGIMATGPALTSDGYEIQFGTNHMGHALLTKLLLPLLTKTAKQQQPQQKEGEEGEGEKGNEGGNTAADVRVVSLTSYMHTLVGKGKFRFDTLKSTAEDLGGYGRYNQSKLANLLWARQLAKKHPELTVAAIHPGSVQTRLLDGASDAPYAMKVATRFAYRFLATVEEGAKNQLWASVSGDVRSGEYYEPVGVVGRSNSSGKDDKLAGKLWDWTEKELESVGGDAAQVNV